MRYVEYRIRLSTIVKACKDLTTLDNLLARIRRKRMSYRCFLIKPVVYIDCIPSPKEQKLAAAFLDFFVPPYYPVCKPAFMFKLGIRKEDLPVFFEEYEHLMKVFYSKYFQLVECRPVLEVITR